MLSLIMATFSERELEYVALNLLRDQGWHVVHGTDISPDALALERTTYDQVVLAQRLREVLDRLNPNLPPAARDDAFRKLTRSEGSVLEARNRAFHNMLVDGVAVEYRSDVGEYVAPKYRLSTSTIQTTMIGLRSISSRSAKADIHGTAVMEECTRTFPCKAAGQARMRPIKAL